MTLYVIPDLVWEINHEWQSAYMISSSAYAWIKAYDEADFEWGVELLNCKTRGEAKTFQNAQSAANDWYKAKMAEGLKVATVEELIAALAESEMKGSET